MAYSRPRCLSVFLSFCDLLLFVWLARIVLQHGLSIFRKHRSPTNSESLTLFSFGKIQFVRRSRGEPLTCYNPFPMNIEEIVQQLDTEISKLQQARKVLQGHDGPFPMVRNSQGRRGPRHLSAAAKARIAAAQRARWAKVKAQKKKAA